MERKNPELEKLDDAEVSAECGRSGRQKALPDPQVIKDQYLAAISMFDSEHGRFWTRFNLFLGFQFIIIAGFASGYETLQKCPGIAVLFICVGVCFAVFAAVIVRRSLMISLAMADSITELESLNADLVLLKTYKKHTKSPLGDIVRMCFTMSVLLVVFWLALFVVFVSTI